jgi:outer membrane protein OmpA-like peptidoglycan-associated protein
MRRIWLASGIAAAALSVGTPAHAQQYGTSGTNVIVDYGVLDQLGTPPTIPEGSRNNAPSSVYVQPQGGLQPYGGAALQPYGYNPQPLTPVQTYSLPSPTPGAGQLQPPPTSMPRSTLTVPYKPSASIVDGPGAAVPTPPATTATAAATPSAASTAVPATPTVTAIPAVKPAEPVTKVATTVPTPPQPPEPPPTPPPAPAAPETIAQQEAPATPAVPAESTTSSTTANGVAVSSNLPEAPSSTAIAAPATATTVAAPAPAETTTAVVESTATEIAAAPASTAATAPTPSAASTAGASAAAAAAGAGEAAEATAEAPTTTVAANETTKAIENAPAGATPPADTTQPAAQPVQPATTTTAPSATTAPAATTTAPATDESQSATAPAEQPAAEPPQDKTQILFPEGSAELPPEASQQLDSIAQKLDQDQALRLQLMAYASGTEDTASRARRISLSRALAVRAYLIDKGIRSTRMDVRALGNKVEGDPADRVDIVTLTP